MSDKNCHPERRKPRQRLAQSKDLSKDCHPERSESRQRLAQSKDLSKDCHPERSESRQRLAQSKDLSKNCHPERSKSRQRLAQSKDLRLESSPASPASTTPSPATPPPPKSPPAPATQPTTPPQSPGTSAHPPQSMRSVRSPAPRAKEKSPATPPPSETRQTKSQTGPRPASSGAAAVPVRLPPPAASPATPRPPAIRSPPAPGRSSRHLPIRRHAHAGCPIHRSNRGPRRAVCARWGDRAMSGFSGPTIIRRLGNRVFQPLQLFPINLIVPQQRQQQPLARVAEESLHGVADLRPACLAFFHARTVDERPPLLPVPHITLLLQNPHRGQH